MNAFRTILCLALVFIFTIPTISAQAEEPTWLFTVPKAKSLDRYNYNLGLLYADFGVNENLEIGIHGLKYSVSGSSLAFGASLFPLMSPYIVKSLGVGSGAVHLGVKAAPYVFFAGFEIPLSSNVKFVAELNGGIFAGVRIFPAQNWTLDIFAAFATVEVYKYRYSRIEIDEFHPIPGILIAYSGRL